MEKKKRRHIGFLEGLATFLFFNDTHSTRNIRAKVKTNYQIIKSMCIGEGTEACAECALSRNGAADVTGVDLF